ncbi:hypothetical protein SLEP1_g21375 [Rubroshorea leprosula]|uniref:Uncharacterized protein n=1 Tax=Rubroshorea leprosula TaxID=152421 RepID=A0AAV5JHQ8_9ROSI|nr:hypothetical protein SLEP1_g21375 [Rubroshorea leprosula]
MGQPQCFVTAFPLASSPLIPLLCLTFHPRSFQSPPSSPPHTPATCRLLAANPQLPLPPARQPSPALLCAQSHTSGLCAPDRLCPGPACASACLHSAPLLALVRHCLHSARPDRLHSAPAHPSHHAPTPLLLHQISPCPLLRRTHVACTPALCASNHALCTEPCPCLCSLQYMPDKVFIITD